MLVPKSIDSTGSDDVTAEMNAFLTSLPKDATVDFPALAEYRCEDTVKLQAKTGVTLNLNGALVYATTRAYRTRAHWRIEGCRDVTLKRPRVRGANPYSGLDTAAYNPETEAQHGIEILQSVGVTIDRPDIQKVFGDFIYIGRKNPTKSWSSWVSIISPYGRDNGRIGIAIIAASVVHITAPNFARMRRSVFDFEPDSTSDGAYAVTVDGHSDSRIGSAHTGYVLASLGKAGIVSDITIRNLYLPDHGLTCQVVSPEGTRTKRNIVIVDNVSEDLLERTPMRFTRVDGVTVWGNTQPLGRPVPLATANDCTGVTIQ